MESLNTTIVVSAESAANQAALSGRINYWGVGSLSCLLMLVCSPFAAVGQHMEAVGGTVSLNITQTLASASVTSMGYYSLLTSADHSHYDEIGYRVAAYARFKVGEFRFFVQPELGYTSSRGQMYIISYTRTPGPLGPDGDTFGHHLRRWEAAILAGAHTSRHTYVLAGPVLAFNRREQALTLNASYPVFAVYNSLYQSVEPVELLAQVGVGVTFGRFDFNLRLEQSLTPYTRRFTFDGGTYGYRQQIRQGLFTAGFLLYKAKPKPVAGRE